MGAKGQPRSVKNQAPHGILSHQPNNQTINKKGRRHWRSLKITGSLEQDQCDPRWLPAHSWRDPESNKSCFEEVERKHVPATAQGLGPRGPWSPRGPLIRRQIVLGPWSGADTPQGPKGQGPWGLGPKGLRGPFSPYLGPPWGPRGPLWGGSQFCLFFGMMPWLRFGISDRQYGSHGRPRSIATPPAPQISREIAKYAKLRYFGLRSGAPTV